MLFDFRWQKELNKKYLNLIHAHLKGWQVRLVPEEYWKIRTAPVKLFVEKIDWRTFRLTLKGLNRLLTGTKRHENRR